MKLRRLGTAMILIFLASSPVGAATLTVTTPNPSIAADGQCSIIEAIINANNDAQTHVDCPAGSGADTIVLSGITYMLTESYDGINGLPVITTPITIEGNNATIARDTSSDETFRLFQVDNDDEASGDLTLDHATVTGGYVEEGGSGIDARFLTLIHSTVTGNTSINGGSGVSGGDHTIVNSTISDNTGHGISCGYITMINSTVSGNTELGIAGCGGALVNSTISGNGGGLDSETLLVTLLNSTIVGNDGSGIHVWIGDFDQGGVILMNTIIADNNGLDCEVDEVQFSSGSLVKDGSCGSEFPPGTDPMLGPLQNNGGPTDTHALLAGSPAIDAGSEVCLDAQGRPPLKTDQRGQPRPVDGNDDGITACDIGAFELQPDVLTVDIDIKPGNKQNVINPRAKGGIWVAVLSDTDPDSPFDPSSQVDISTVEFGPDGAKARRHKVQDTNKDELGDLLLRFMIPATGITCGDTEATLTGETFDGQSFTGTISIKTVGCKPESGSLHGGLLYAVETDTETLISTLISIDTDSFIVTPIGPVGVPYRFGGLAYDPHTDTLYMNSGWREGNLYSVDRTTGQATLIGNHGVWGLLGLAFDSTNNILYGTEKGPYGFYSLNTTTGDATNINPSMSAPIDGLAYDSKRDMLVGLQPSVVAELYAIDRATGALTLLSTYPFVGNVGLAYDSDNDLLWSLGGDLFFYDPNDGYSQTLRLMGLGGTSDGLAYVPANHDIAVDDKHNNKKHHKKHHHGDRDTDKRHNGKHKEKKYHDRDHDDDHKKR